MAHAPLPAGLTPGHGMYEASSPSRLQKRSLSLYGHRTSIALEGEFWQVLEVIAQREGLAFAAFIARLDRHRPPEQALASLLRLTALRFALQQPAITNLPQTSAQSGR
ncbi:ribbon-helix-helix domain-containing protein [Bombella dulcis]|nr:ribbon-helix-helix domain-containing protein [Bombella dulcis]